MLSRLPLITVSGRLFTLNYEFLDDLRRELDSFVSNNSHINNRLFSKKIMFTHELKANNTIEGINDDLEVIERVIDNARQIKDEEKRNRIINLYRGYKFILEGHDISEETFIKLYKILSNDLLDRYSLANMGPRYRKNRVLILNHGRMDDSYDEGVPYEWIQELMDCYFNYINNGEVFGDDTGYFIKSQIMHFYLVYIHPFFDVNGRTSRTTAMWYLLNHDIYPFIIFNRGINFDSTYDDTIKECKDRHELTKFIRYMMINTKKELEKEYVMHSLSSNNRRKLRSIDYQTLEYFITMTGQKSVLDFCCMYNRFNAKKRVVDIFYEMIYPFLEDGTFVVERETKKNMFGNHKNMILSLNRDKLQGLDRSQLTRISL